MHTAVGSVALGLVPPDPPLPRPRTAPPHKMRVGEKAVHDAVAKRHHRLVVPCIHRIYTYTFTYLYMYILYNIF